MEKPQASPGAKPLLQDKRLKHFVTSLKTSPPPQGRVSLSRQDKEQAGGAAGAALSLRCRKRLSQRSLPGPEVSVTAPEGRPDPKSLPLCVRCLRFACLQLRALCGCCGVSGVPGAMRCSLKRSLSAALAASFLLLLLFLYGGSRQEQDPPEVELRALAPDVVLQLLQPEGAQRILRDTGSLSALHNVSYHLLAGSLSPHKKFLAVGLASVQRPRGYYLPATLQSLFKQSTEEELQEMVVVVHLADTDPMWNVRVAANIATRFAQHILLGRLLLIHAPHEFYPTLEGLKRNFNDPEERVRFRSKQNVDYAFLLAFTANLSSYYLMIEDDVWCAKSFLTAIRKALASQEGSNWATLEFSKLGYIGKLYRSSDLPRLARFLLLFYQEMPCDWLLVHFRLLLTQKDAIRFKPSLFQHMGLYSSFQGTVNRLEDDEFQADAMDLPDNPPAALFTTMSVFENYEPLKAYSSTEGYFWGKDPAAGSTFSIVFQQPARVTRVRVRTGSAERRGDILHAGVLELGRRRRGDGRDCSAYTVVGTFENGSCERLGLERGIPGPVECVRIRVTRDQSEWLIIQSIEIWTMAGS
ncbi:alpha-1,6-mannosyl-glycoprotein 4-beta-N-acetylglucosaminyltransferase-like isoform X2 [Melopsittacus undulatus]|uniref:alpha-1,6-mannosyl-glycoprotein 4-beta-N-acetylglucosaminyltransferase-like isoform X2 n=1 Tax=Melopsittacus undulatus TaxID=13146 RepID=UPI00146E4759|nr:alpha-1,6-mannosyl-glycoprotein 4-beta-N-acetylglucosaminyltransferase-like isoform X2 [Melopsittacus undulatus]